MGRALAMLLLAGIVVSACSSSSPPQQSVQGASQQGNGGGGGGGGGGAGLQAAAALVKDVCPLVPADLETKLVPGATPQSQTFPPYQCTVSNGTIALQVTLGAYDTGGPVAGAESVSGLAAGGYFERLTPDDAYLTVLLAPDQGELYVEISDPSNADHKNDVIDVAKAVLANLH